MSAFDGVNSPQVAIEFYAGGTWVQVAQDDVLMVNVTRGRTSPAQAVQPGVLTVTVSNRSGIYDPDYTGTSPWVIGGQTVIKTGLPCRLRFTWNSITYDRFYGYLETPRLNQGINPTVTFTFADGMATIGRSIAPVLTAAQFTTYTGETVSARAARMLDLAGWPSGARAITGHTVTLNGDRQDRSALSILQECAAAVGGRFYVSRSNVATLEGIGAKFSKPTRLAFNDDGTAYTVKYLTLTTGTGTDGLYNDATVSRAPLQTYRATYSAGVAAQGLRSLAMAAPVYTNTAAQNLALLYARQWADPVARINDIAFDGMNLGILYPDLLALEIGDLVSATRHTVDGRTAYYQLVVEGETYTMQAGAWVYRLHTAPVNPYTITV